MTNTKSIATQIGTTEKKIRQYARKNFLKTETANWSFTEEQIAQMVSALAFGGTLKPTTTTVQSEVNGLTENELKVINWIITTGFWNGEEGFSDIDAKDVAKGIKQPIKSVRGYLGSLIKKDYLQIEEYEETDLPIIYAGDKLTYNEETNKYEI